MPRTVRYPLNIGLNEPVTIPPVPHDCGIESISFDEEQLVFRLEEDITVHDGMNFLFPGAKSLVIRFHLCDPLFFAYEEQRPDEPGGKFRYEELDPAELTQDAIRQDWKLEYLYHWIAYRSVIVQLWCGRDIILRIDADRIEYEWIE